jgi:hypothetical protein
MFSNTGVNAATANRRCAFKMLPASAVSDTKKMYGNVNRSIRTVTGKRPASSRKPGANTRITIGAAITPISVIANSTSASVPVVRSSKSRVSAGERVARYSEITGTNACENAPSPKNRRSRFGILNATANASITGPAPNHVEKLMSRASPVTRDRNVNAATTPVDLNSRSDPAAGEPSAPDVGVTSAGFAVMSRMSLPRPSPHRDVRRRAPGMVFRRVSGGIFET